MRQFGGVDHTAHNNNVQHHCMYTSAKSRGKFGLAHCTRVWVANSHGKE